MLRISLPKWVWSFRLYGPGHQHHSSPNDLHHQSLLIVSCTKFDSSSLIMNHHPCLSGNIGHDRSSSAFINQHHQSVIFCAMCSTKYRVDLKFDHTCAGSRWGSCLPVLSMLTTEDFGIERMELIFLSPPISQPGPCFLETVATGVQWRVSREELVTMDQDSSWWSVWNNRSWG